MSTEYTSGNKAYPLIYDRNAAEKVATTRSVFIETYLAANYFAPPISAQTQVESYEMAG